MYGQPNFDGYDGYGQQAGAFNTGQSGLTPSGGSGYASPQQQWMSVPVGGGGPPQGAFMPQELPHYQQLFQIADLERKGFIDAQSGFNVLSASGLPREILAMIWSIADSNGQGGLTQEQFYACMRLVAHAQAGVPPTPDLMGIPPGALPEFEGLQRRRTESELSPRSGQGPPSVIGGQSDVSDLQPVITETERDVRRAAEYVRRSSPSPHPRPFERHRWAPTEREKRKYASLFLRMDWNKSGVVEAREAKALLERARLDNETLACAWELADYDRDGRLTFQEFVALIHLISCVKKGAPMPNVQEGLPPELLHALANLNEPPELLAAQRSRSPSPAPASPVDFFASSRDPSPAPVTRLPAEAPAPDAFPASDFSAPAPDGFPPQDGFPKQGDFNDDFGFGEHDGGAFADKKDKKKDKKDKKDKKTNESEPPGFSAPTHDSNFGDFRPDSSFDFGPTNQPELSPSADVFSTQTHHHHHHPKQKPRRPSRDMIEDTWDSSREPSRRQAPDLRDRERDREQRDRDIQMASQHFSAVIEADRAVSQQLRAEVDKLEEEARHVRDTQNRVDGEVREERRKCESMSSEQRQLEQKLQEAKNRLSVLRDERRAVDVESISLRRDRDHFSDELAFLQKMMQDEERTLECLRQTNTGLEKSYSSMEGQTKQLERERRSLIEQVAEERRLVQIEERHNAEVRNRLERLQREQVAVVQSRRQQYEREMRREEMQSGNPVVAASRPGKPSAPNGHSWASILASDAAVPVVPSSSPAVIITPAASRPADQMRSSLATAPPRQLVATGPLSREGV